MRPTYLIILLVLNFFWAASLSAYKVIEQYLEPGGLVTLRFGIAAVPLFLAWRWIPGTLPRGRDLPLTIIVGLIVFALGHRCQVWGTNLGTAGNASILVAIEPLFAAVAAAIFLHEHIGPRRWIGFAFGLFGVVLLNGVWRADFKWMNLGASLLFLASLACEICYSIVGKKIMTRKGPPTNATDVRQSVSPLKILALALTAGTVANLLIDGPTTFAAAGKMSAQGWWLLLGLALICTTFGYSFWFLIIREGEVNVASLTLFSQPVFGVLVAMLWLKEPLHWGQLWGSAAIIVGLVIGLSRQIKPRAEKS